MTDRAQNMQENSESLQGAHKDSKSLEFKPVVSAGNARQAYQVFPNKFFKFLAFFLNSFL